MLKEASPFYGVALLLLFTALLQQTLLRVVGDLETFVSLTPVVTAASTTAATLEKPATWADYFKSPAFWFPNLFNLVWLVTLLVAFVKTVIMPMVSTLFAKK
jgi:Na+/phosphate symporter